MIDRGSRWTRIVEGGNLGTDGNLVSLMTIPDIPFDRNFPNAPHRDLVDSYLLAS